MITTTMRTQTYILGLVLAASLPVRAALYEYASGAISLGIPDNSTIGLAAPAAPGDFTPVFGVGEDYWSITALTLSFTLTGGDVNDLSGYLRLGNATDSPYCSILPAALTPVSDTYTIDFTTTAFADAFSGKDPNNTWTLFFADTAAGDQTTLTSWSLNITAVPEPTTWAGLIFGGGLAFFYAVRSRVTRSKICR